MERIEIWNHNRNKIGSSGKKHGSLLAEDLLFNLKFWKQLNGYSYKKRMVTPCIESMDRLYIGRISDSTCYLNAKHQCPSSRLTEKGGSMFL